MCCNTEYCSLRRTFVELSIISSRGPCTSKTLILFYLPMLYKGLAPLQGGNMSSSDVCKVPGHYATWCHARCCEMSCRLPSPEQFGILVLFRGVTARECTHYSEYVVPPRFPQSGLSAERTSNLILSWEVFALSCCFFLSDRCCYTVRWHAIFRFHSPIAVKKCDYL